MSRLHPTLLVLAAALCVVPAHALLIRADRDDDHLQREPVRERRDPEQRKVAQLQRGGQAMPHERER